MATKSHHKLRRSKVKRIATQLERISQTIAERGIYGVCRDNGSYSIVDIPTGRAVMGGLPTRSVANSAARHFNKHGFSRIHGVCGRLTAEVDRYYRLRDEILHYQHAISQKPGQIHLYDRIDETQNKLVAAHREINRLFCA